MKMNALRTILSFSFHFICIFMVYYTTKNHDTAQLATLSWHRTGLVKCIFQRYYVLRTTDQMLFSFRKITHILAKKNIHQAVILCECVCIAYTIEFSFITLHHKTLSTSTIRAKTKAVICNYKSIIYNLQQTNVRQSSQVSRTHTHTIIYSP